MRTGGEEWKSRRGKMRNRRTLTSASPNSLLLMSTMASVGRPRSRLWRSSGHVVLGVRGEEGER